MATVVAAIGLLTGAPANATSEAVPNSDAGWKTAAAHTAADGASANANAAVLIILGKMLSGAQLALNQGRGGIVHIPEPTRGALGTMTAGEQLASVSSGRMVGAGFEQVAMGPASGGGAPVGSQLRYLCPDKLYTTGTIQNAHANAPCGAGGGDMTLGDVSIRLNNSRPFGVPDLPVNPTPPIQPLPCGGAHLSLSIRSITGNGL